MKGVYVWRGSLDMEAFINKQFYSNKPFQATHNLFYIVFDTDKPF